MGFSENVDWLEPSATLAISARARALREEGRTVVDLSAGEPVFPTPDFAAEAGVAAIRAGRTGYPPTPGVPELRRAAAGYLTETTGREVAPGQILVSAGVKQALFNCVFTLFGPGDEVLVPTPCWTSYAPQVGLARAEGVAVETRWKDGFLPTTDRLEHHRTSRTRGLLLNSPGNPTGVVYGLELLEEIAEWARRHDIWILCDEIYRRLHFGEGLAPSLFEAGADPRRSVVLDGVSKAFSMPGWRIGFAAGPEALIGRASDFQSQTTSGAATPSQYAAAEALGRREEARRAVAGFMEHLRATRRQAVEGLSSVRGLKVLPPAGGIFVFVRLEGREGSAAVAEELLAEGGVAAVPGEAFDAPGHLRFNFAVEPETLEDGLRRIREFFEGR